MATKSTKSNSKTESKKVEKAPAGKSAATKSDKKMLFKAIFTDWDAREKGMPYRIIAVESECTLYKLAEMVNKSFNFKLDQPFGFYNNLTKWERSEVSYEMMNELGDIDDKKLKKTPTKSVFTKKGDKYLYFFDYAEEWRFLVEYIGEEKIGAKEKLPFVVEVVGEAPPQYGDSLGLDEDDDDDLFLEEDDEDDIFSDSPKPKKKKDEDDVFNVDEFDDFAKGGFDDFGSGGFDDFDDKF
jgi:hypothetical protein